jgi:NAD-dependent dihydropyrimidine dehydrogenase PreA subunit
MKNNKMALRNIVKIDQDKCNGCGLCAGACAEGAISIINGKAQLISETYCDGLGACIGHCPQNAITVEQRESAKFDEDAVKAHLAQQKQPPIAFVCPGMAMRNFRPAVRSDDSSPTTSGSQLGQWPVQLSLVSPNALYFSGADLILVADCVPVAVGNFHNRFLKGRSIAMGCPKLDNAQFYVEKFSAILKANNLAGLTVVHMEVPCCSGLTRIARQAIESIGLRMSFKDITISLQGEVIGTEVINCGD